MGKPIQGVGDTVEVGEGRLGSLGGGVGCGQESGDKQPPAEATSPPAPLLLLHTCLKSLGLCFEGL